jgi:hypothetical protein
VCGPAATPKGVSFCPVYVDLEFVLGFWFEEKFPVYPENAVLLFEFSENPVS